MALTMQQLYGFFHAKFARDIFILAIIITLSIAISGCERPTTIDPIPERPFDGINLTISADRDEDRELAREIGRSWSLRTGGKLSISEKVWDGSTDIAIISPAELSHWAEKGVLEPLPSRFKETNGQLRWDDYFNSLTLRLLVWKDVVYGLPLTSEGAVLVYRKDAFPAKEGQIAYPVTWDDFIAMGSKLKAGSISRLGSDEIRSMVFHSVAACTDRVLVSRLVVGNSLQDDFFSFQFDASTGEPRILKSAFLRAAEIVHEMDRLAEQQNPVQAFQSGKAKLGILSLKELGQIGTETASKLGVAPLPGSKYTYDKIGKKIDTPGMTLNRVAYLGWGGKFIVVSKSCKNPEAAWHFVLDSCDPDRMALDLISSNEWCSGPSRSSQIESRSRPRWLGYGLTLTETDRLLSALRDNLGMGSQNYRLHLRTPNQKELSRILDEELKSLSEGKVSPEIAMRNVDKRWREITGKIPPGEWKTQIRKSLGL